MRAIRESRRLAGIRAAAEALVAREDRAAAAVGPRVPFQLALPEGSVEALAAAGVIGPIEIPTQYGPPPPPTSTEERSWGQRLREMGERWGQTFARAFEGGGGLRGALASILTTEVSGQLAPLGEKVSGALSGVAGRIGGVVGKGLGMVASMAGPLIGSLAGPMLAGLRKLGGKIWGGIKRLFGGPSQHELAGREARLPRGRTARGARHRPPARRRRPSGGRRRIAGASTWPRRSSRPCSAPPTPTPTGWRPSCSTTSVAISDRSRG